MLWKKVVKKKLLEFTCQEITDERCTAMLEIVGHERGTIAVDTGLRVMIPTQSRKFDEFHAICGSESSARELASA